jgi:cyclic-di-GMP-binding protein
VVLMSDPYRRLSEALPVRRPAGPGSFPTDPKRVKAWIDALPRANQAATFKLLGEALAAQSETQMEGAQRLGVLEVLRPLLLEACAALAQQAQGGTIPLPPAKARAFEQLVQFDLALAKAYRLAVVEYCAPSGSIPFLRGGGVAQALERATLHTSRSLANAYFLYQQPPAGLWAALHALFRFARAHKLDEKPIDEAAESRPLQLRQIYLQTQLIALSNPFRFSQKEQAELWKLGFDLAAMIELHDTLGAGDLFGIPLDSDSGPGYIPAERAANGDVVLWIDLSGLRGVVDQAIDGAVNGTATLRLKGSRGVDVAVDLLRRLRGGWGRGAARRNQRLAAGHVLETTLGLSGVHFHLAGLIDFDTFLRQAGAAEQGQDGDRALWAHAAVDAGRMPLQRAEVLDQSLGGYHLRWAAEENVKARVGEMIGLSVPGDGDERQWLLGVVRWLRYAGDGAVDAGIELLSRRVRAVALRVPGRSDAERPPQRGIEYQPVRNAEEGRLYFSAPVTLEAYGAQIEVLRVPDLADIDEPVPMKERLGQPQVLENAGDYLLLGMPRSRAA